MLRVALFPERSECSVEKSCVVVSSLSYRGGVKLIVKYQHFQPRWRHSADASLTAALQSNEAALQSNQAALQSNEAALQSKEAACNPIKQLCNPIKQ